MLRLPSPRPPAAFAGADPEIGALAGLLAAGTALVTFAAVLVVGVVGLALPLAVVGLLACVRWPWLPVVILLGGSLLVDQYFGELPAPGFAFYEGAFGGISPWELLIYLAVGCVALDCVRRRALPPLPPSIAIALMLMAVAVALGSIVGWSAGAGLKTQVEGLRNVLPLLLIAPLVAAVLPANAVRPALGVTAVLVGAKALLGLGLTMQRGGPSVENLIYYEITMNWLFLALVLCVVACRVCGVRLPWWVWVAAALCLVMLALGLKRALWIGSVAGLSLILALGLSRVGRRLFVPAVLVIVAVGWLLLSAGVTAPLDGPIAQRVQSLDPQKVTTNTQDRYRLDERANVWLEIKQHPLVGLGQGVPWHAIKPLGIEREGARDYVHFGVLWFWMKYTLLGAIAYLALLGTTIMVGIRVHRWHPDPLLAAVGLGLAASFAALAVAELTVTWTGANPRFTVMAGAAIGVLGVLDAPARAARRRFRDQRADSWAAGTAGL